MSASLGLEHVPRSLAITGENFLKIFYFLNFQLLATPPGNLELVFKKHIDRLAPKLYSESAESCVLLLIMMALISLSTTDAILMY